MVKETVTYTDFNGERREDTLYFNLTDAEWLKLDASYQYYGGMADFIKRAARTNDKEGILTMFERLLLTSYGERPDGIRFIKSKEISEAFGYSEAYSALLMKFLRNTDEGTRFFNALAPKDLAVESK